MGLSLSLSCTAPSPLPSLPLGELDLLYFTMIHTGLQTSLPSSPAQPLLLRVRGLDSAWARSGWSGLCWTKSFIVVEDFKSSGLFLPGNPNDHTTLLLKASSRTSYRVTYRNQLSYMFNVVQIFSRLLCGCTSERALQT